jgi:hypothetical protein
MSEQLSAILLTTLIILVIIGTWGAMIAFVYRDTGRRNLPGWQRFIGFTLVALFPIIGFVAYLFARQLVMPVSGPPTGAEGRSPQRVTLLKPARPGGGKRLPTIPAAEYIRAAKLAQRNAAPQPGQGRASASQSCVLAVTEGPHVGQEFVVDHLPAYIGRGPDCTIRLDNDRGVSRRHAELYWQGGALRLRDLGSTHGTHVNGNNINDKGLKPDDKIRVGYSLLSVKTSR